MDKFLPSTGLDDVALRTRRILQFLRRKWWIPVLFALVAGAAQAAYTLTRPAGYTGVARMWVGGKIRIPESSFFSEEWQNFFGTQMELMESEKIRRRVLTKLQKKAPQAPLQILSLDVSQPRKTTIFNLTARGDDPEYVESYLNTMMDEYLEYKKEVRASSSDDTVANLSEQLERIERDIQAEQEKLELFQKTNNVTVLQEVSVSSGSQLNKLHLQLADFKLESKMLALISPEEHLEALLKADEKLSTALAGALGQEYFSARQKRDLKKIERRERSEFLRPKHPLIIKLDEEISQLESLLDIYIKEGRERLEAAQETFRLKIEAVEEAIQLLEPRVIAANERIAEFERNKINRDRLETMRSQLVLAIHKVDVNKSVDQESVTILDKAAVFPTPQRVPFKIGLTSAVAMFLGLGLVLFLERRDQRVLTSGELKASLTVRLLGLLPEMGKPARNERLALLSPEDERAMLVESFRNVRGCIQTWRLPEGRPGGGRSGDSPRTLLITSAMPGEGKSTVAVNLGLSLAFAGFRVLLVEGDLRRGQIQEVLGLEETGGAGRGIEGGSGPAGIRQTSTPNLSFLKMEVPKHRSGEIPGLHKFGGFLEKARADFDFVLVDSPPVLSTADACTLASVVDAVVVVVRSRSTPLPMVARSIEMLQDHNARLIGTVLNRVDPVSSDYPFYLYEAYHAPRPASAARNGQAKGGRPAGVIG